MARYYIEMEGYRYGPFELQELKQLNQDGVLKGDQIYEEQSNQLFSLTRLLAEYQASQPTPEPIPQVQTFAQDITAAPEVAVAPEASVTPEATPAPEAPVTPEASPAPEAPESVTSESWSERLSRLKAARNEQTSEAVESPMFSGSSDTPVNDFSKDIANSTAVNLDAVVPEPSEPGSVEPGSIMDAATNELMEEMVADLDDLPSVARNKDELPDMLVTNGSHPEELINYNAAIKDDIGDQDLTIKLKNLSGDAKTAAGDDNAGSFPTSLGYMKDAMDLEPPTEWLVDGVGSAGAAGSAKEVKLPEPFSAFTGGRGSAPAPADSVPTTSRPLVEPVAPQEQDGSVSAPSEQSPASSQAPVSSQTPTSAQVPQPRERSADEASAWREQMARLDVVYGVRESTASKDLQAFGGQDHSADAASLTLSGASEFDGEYDDSEDKPPEKSSAKLGSLVFIVAGLVALLARTNYMALTEMPGLIVTAVLCGYAVLTAICGILLWIDAERFTPALSIVMLCLLLFPFAMLGYTLFVYQESVMALQIPQILQLPLAYMGASLIMHALGLAILKKTPKNAEND